MIHCELALWDANAHCVWSTNTSWSSTNRECAARHRYASRPVSYEFWGKFIATNGLRQMEPLAVGQFEMLTCSSRLWTLLSGSRWQDCALGALNLLPARPSGTNVSTTLRSSANVTCGTWCTTTSRTTCRDHQGLNEQLKRLMRSRPTTTPASGQSSAALASAVCPFSTVEWSLEVPRSVPRYCEIATLLTAKHGNERNQHEVGRCYRARL